MIIDEIKKQNMEALKAHDNIKKTVLSIVMNKYMLAKIEFKSQQKEITDSDMVAILQKTIKELVEESENYLKAGNEKMSEEIKIQQKELEKFLPNMMSKEEISAQILSLEDKGVGSVMKHFKTNFAGKCDMREVQEVLKNINA